MYVHAAESQRSKPTHGGTGVHPNVRGKQKIKQEANSKIAHFQNQ
jgi:hypothetical protein